MHALRTRQALSDGTLRTEYQPQPSYRLSWPQGRLVVAQRTSPGARAMVSPLAVGENAHAMVSPFLWFKGETMAWASARV